MEIGYFGVADFLLGGFRTKGSLTSSDDLNNKQTGFYTCNTAQGGVPQNAPSDLNNASFVYIGFGEGTTWGAQFIITTSTTPVLFFRSYVSTVRNWQRIQVQT